MTFGAELDKAAAAAVCGWLAGGGNALAAEWIVGGVKTPATAVAGAAAALGLLALNYGCSFDPNGGLPVGDYFPEGCYKVVTGDRLVFGLTTGSDLWSPPFHEFISLVDTKRSGGYGTTYWRLTFKLANGTVDFVESARLLSEVARDKLWVLPGGTCVADGGKPVIGNLEPYTYIDATSNCTYVVEHQAWLMQPDKNARPVLKISPVLPSRASGGIISGCNFSPVLYVPPGGGGGGGGHIGPWDPTGPIGPNGEPWWWDVLQTALGGLAADLIKKIFGKFFEEKLDGITYRLVSACETDAQGEPIDRQVEVVIPQLPVFEAIEARLNALPLIDQGLKDFKQPVCSPHTAKPYIGRNISIQFRSAAVSPWGERPLRKGFRYRDPSLKPLEDHRTHWADFTWKSGPFMVISDGLDWGRPQVWAESEAEGKRVIAHAATIAGLDLKDAKHKWIVREINGVRENPVLEMRVHRDVHGLLWVAERNQSAGLPEVVAM
jgi:hypothetical protein